MNSNSFEEYLMNKHADQYVGTDDMMPDDFEDWIQGLGSDDLIDYAEQWGKLLVNANTPK